MSTSRLASSPRKAPPTDVRLAILKILRTPRWVTGGALSYWTRDAVARHSDLEGVAGWRVQTLIASLLIMGDAEELPGGKLVLRPSVRTPTSRPRRALTRGRA